MSKPLKSKKVRVTLKKPITHAGTPKQAGDKISVHPDIAEWLRNQGII